MYRIGAQLFRLSCRFSSSVGSSESSAYVLRLSGLSFQASKQDLLSFLGTAASDVNEVNLLRRSDGQATGNAYVSFSTEKGYQDALSKDKQYMGERWIEMLPSKQEEMEYFTLNYGHFEQHKSWERDFVVRLQGLPYRAKDTDVVKFFNGLQIAEDGIRVVLMENRYSNPRDRTKCTGIGYVKFADLESAQGALERNKENIGHRYIEVFKSSVYDMLATTRGLRPFTQKQKQTDDQSGS